MKKKYNKLTFYLVVLIMGIGMVTFPIENKKTAGEEAEEKDAAQTSVQSAFTPNAEFLTVIGKDAADRKAIVGAKEDIMLTPTPEPTFAISPEPTQTPDLPAEQNTLIVDVPEDIIAFVENYFAVRLNGTAEEYQALFYDGGNLDESLTNRRVEYIVAYHNLKCYAKRGIGEVDYVLYVQNDVEIATIDTYAPSIDQLFIKYDAAGHPKLYMHGDSFSKSEKVYYDDLRLAEDVTALIADVNVRLAAAIESDEALRDFFSRLNEETANK